MMGFALICSSATVARWSPPSIDIPGRQKSCSQEVATVRACPRNLAASCRCDLHLERPLDWRQRQGQPDASVR
jgi:hypothetical protein